MVDTLSFTYIGHATVLIQIGGMSIITDPHFGKSTLIFKRKSALPLKPQELPDLSAVLLSHTHFDHLHISDYKYISCSVPIIVPEGSERAIGQYMPNTTIELSHYAEYELPNGIKITAVPAMHRSSRLSHLRFKKSNAYLIRSTNPEASIFFCADSGYGPHFAEIGNLGKIDVAFLPIGGYKPRFLFKRCHMTPAEAVRAFEDLRASHMIPIHHGTFRLSLEALDAPRKWLEKIISERADLGDKIHILKPGEKFSL